MKNKIMITAIILGLIILILAAAYFKISFWVFGLAFFLLIAAYTVKLSIAWRKGDKFFSALKGQTTGEHQLEVSALQEKMNLAIEKLRASGLHAGYRGAAALYALPWYMIIGPSAAGKSTLLRHSNLNFPYSANDKIDIKGFAGTRNCDWWFADEAIILDTAGRYTMEESDKPEWLAFLKLLRTHRRRAPVNGVIVALSLEEILHADHESLMHHCQVIRHKLDELNKELGIVIPVQLIITKCDLLEGFDEFFRDLSPESRDQVWGVRLAGNQFESGLRDLVDKLSDWRLHKIGMSTKVDYKHSILSFPLEFEKAVDKIIDFLDALMHKNHYQEQPDFRGVYFTSALQEKKQESRVRSYFIRDLFRKIIFQDKRTRKNAKQTTLHQRLRWTGMAVAVCLSVLVLTMLQMGYRTQSELYAKQDAMIKTLGSRTSYDQFSGILKVYQHYDHLKKIEAQHLWRFLIGYNSLEKQIHDQEALFAAYFTPFMQKPAQASLEKMIQNDTQRWPNLDEETRAGQYAAYYDELKTYLMLNDKNKLEPGFAAKKLNFGWLKHVQDNQLAIPLSLSAAPTEAMFKAYLSIVRQPHAHQTLPAINPMLVQSARDALYMSPDAQLLYQHLVSRGQHELGMASLQDLLQGQDQGLLVNKYPFPKMYTKAEFEKSVLPMMQSIASNAGTGDWVLQDNTTGSLDRDLHEKWVHELRALYFQDYTKHWMNWLAALEVKTFYSLEDASNKLLKLAREDGPLFSVMKEIDRNFSWGAPELNSAKASIAQVLHPETLKDYLSQLSIIQSDLTALSSSSDPLRDSELFARKVLAETGQTSLAMALNSVHGLSNLGPDSKAAILSFLKSPIQQSWRTVLNSAGTYIQHLWEVEVIPAYNQSLRGKFPFDKSGSEVAIDDVSSFFNPNDGVLSQFYANVLKPYLKQNKNGWTEHQWMGEGIGFSTSFLQTLAQGDQITHALFRPGSSDPKFTFYVQPVAIPGLDEIIFDTNGQEYRYRNEPEEWRRFTWPGEASQIGARLYASASQNKQSAEIEHQGVWGLFHLLSDAKFVKQGGTQYLTEWKMRNYAGQTLSVKLKIKADKQSNVLDPHVMSQFKVPDSIKSTQGSRG